MKKSRIVHKFECWMFNPIGSAADNPAHWHVGGKDLLEDAIEHIKAHLEGKRLEVYGIVINGSHTVVWDSRNV